MADNSNPSASENHNQNRSHHDNIQTLLVTSGVLAGIMVVWVQIWQSAAEYYKAHGYPLLITGYGLFYSYLAILCSIIAFILLIVSTGQRGINLKKKAALWFLSFSFIVTLLICILFVLNVMFKSLFNPNSLIEPLQIRFIYWPLSRFMILVVAPVIIFIFSVLLVSLNDNLVKRLLGFEL